MNNRVSVSWQFLTHHIKQRNGGQTLSWLVRQIYNDTWLGVGSTFVLVEVSYGSYYNDRGKKNDGVKSITLKM